ncbi:MAG TPA: MFS transporter [Usitatibacter sp.]|nr:MFS transporter [Usitatibacter sp.]
MPLALIVTATVLAHAAFNGSRLTISLNALSMGASPLVVGVMMSLFAALPMLLGVPSGRLVDRVGVRGPLLAATALLALAVVLPGAIPGIVSLYLAAAGAGTGFMLFHIAVQHTVGEGSAEDQRKTNFGWLALGFSISNFFGPTSAGLSIDTFGFGPTFLLLACAALASFALIAVRRHAFTHTPHAVARGGRRSALDLLRDAELRRVFLVTGLLASAWDLFVFVMPIHGTAIGLSASTIGLILGAFALATFLIRVFLPWIQRYLREWTMITTTMAIACAAYALFPVVDTVPLLAATAFLLGLGLGATQPSIMSLLYAKAPAGRAAEAVGVRSVVLNASHTVLPLAFGGVGAALGMTPVFLTMSGLLAAGGFFSHRRRRAESAGIP